MASINGGSGNDTITGSIGSDTLSGLGGDDTLYAGTGTDKVYGGDGSDVLFGGGDNDELYGGNDADRFVIVEDGIHGQNTTVWGGSGGNDDDVLNLSHMLASGYEIVNLVQNPDNAGAAGFQGQVQMFKSATNTWANINFYDIERIVPCFTPDTLIATEHGEKRAIDLRVGDRVLTRDSGFQDIAWIGKKTVSAQEMAAHPRLRPVRIRAGALGSYGPQRDMIVSPNHRILSVGHYQELLFEESEVLVAAKYFVHADGVDHVAGQVTYVHFMFDQHQLVLSDGMWTESFQPGAYSLRGVDSDQRHEIFELWPELQCDSGLNTYQAARKSLTRHEAALLM